MTATYDLTTDIGKIRLLIPDRDISDPVFTDEELQVYLDAGGNVRYASAAALETIAINEVLLYKVMKSGTDSIDAAKAADVPLKRADRLRSQEDTLSLVGEIGVVEMINGQFGARQYLKNMIRRAV